MIEEFLAFVSAFGIGEISIVAILIFTSVLLLGLLIGSKYNWIVKSFTTLIAGISFALMYFAIIDMQGWPTKDIMPDPFEYLAHYVDPPNPSIGKEGFIVLWILRIEQEVGQKPRAHLLSYDKEIHKKLEEARKKKATGQRVKGTLKGKGDKGKKKEKGDKKQGKNRRPPDSTYKDLMFYNMPKPILPTK